MLSSAFQVEARGLGVQDEVVQIVCVFVKGAGISHGAILIDGGMHESRTIRLVAMSNHQRLGRALTLLMSLQVTKHRPL
jgi:hypothetical protein